MGKICNFVTSANIVLLLLKVLFKKKNATCCKISTKLCLQKKRSTEQPNEKFSWEH